MIKPLKDATTNCLEILPNTTLCMMSSSQRQKRKSLGKYKQCTRHSRQISSHGDNFQGVHQHWKTKQYTLFSIQHTAYNIRQGTERVVTK